MIDLDYSELRKNLALKNRQKFEGGSVIEFEAALEIIKSKMTGQLMEEMDAELKSKSKETERKDKKYLRVLKSRYRDKITEIVLTERLFVRGYNGEKINEFIEEVIEEMCGYSVLAKAFEDPAVTDIYVIDWKTIFVEKGGNIPYIDKNGNPITFKSEKHYKDTIDRFLRVANQEVNNGENKIVDFELYGDRGCVTSAVISPKGYSLTIRKHLEDHITMEDLLKNNVMSKDLADFFGTTIAGECNIIYAGITGSGKTTSIRAIIDHYVTQLNKRILVCEDTQELGLKNKHTLELVTFKHEQSNLAVTLSGLVKTSLRLKPRIICIGEVRGVEAMDMIEAAETGHCTITTMHGGKPWNIINRLATKYLLAMPALGIDVVERIIGEAIDYICIQDYVPDVGFKVTSVSEVSYDFVNRTISIKPIYEYDFISNRFELKNKISKEKAYKMMRRGVKPSELEPWCS